MLNGRKRLISALSALALATVVGLVPATSASAEPQISDVQTRVDRLYHEAEQASERSNDARLELQELRKELTSLTSDQARQDERLGKVQAQVAASIVRQYEGQGLSVAGQVVVADDPSAFLNELSTMSAFNDLQAQMFDEYATELKALDIRREATAKRTAQLASTEKQLADEQKLIEDKLSEAKSLLGKLEAEERDALSSRDTVRMPTDVPVSGRAAAAVNYAHGPGRRSPTSTAPPAPTPSTARA